MNGHASSSFSFNYQWTYEVFISFRGEGTRHNFTGNLYNALCQKGIHTFIDDKELKKGDEITPTLTKAIQESWMAIIVFSENYASSTFCLNELVEILQYIKRKGRLVWPIFYDVEPSNVRYQKGTYEEAFAVHTKRFKADQGKVQSWKKALHEAASLSGLHFNPRNGYEYQFIEQIVKEIFNESSRIPLSFAKLEPVGLESRVLEINSLLGVESANDTIDMVGIFGIGGIGKTTVARAVYNSIADHFECLCFLHDIKEESRKYGLVQLQQKMISEILGVDIKVGDINKGVSIIKRRLNKKKVLLILDNIDKREQLEKLAGDCDWFGPGSRVIITTRDKHLLATHGVEKKYEMEKLNDEESLKLLCRNAFKNDMVDGRYKEALNMTVHYAQGLPLALEVIGSNMFGKTVEEWNSALDRYKKIPIREIQQLLKISYDSLEEDEQEIFLDIACFFKGHSLEYVKNKVECTRGDPTYGIRVLIDKSLIKTENNFVIMHDLIQDMGREIVRQESPTEPGKRSRLWFHEDIIHVLENKTGTDNVGVIILDYPDGDININWDGKALKKMKNLKVLSIKNASFSTDPTYLPNSLRILQWQRYPSSRLPVDFCPTKLVILDLPDSFLELLDLEPAKRLENLSIMNFSDCQSITRIPDVSGSPNLRKLNLGRCRKLIEVHSSVGYLRKLEFLSVLLCDQLSTFPQAIKLPSLKHLGLLGCSSLEKFPEVLEKMEYIETLDLSMTNLELPFSIHNLTQLERLLIVNCGRVCLPSSITMLPQLYLIAAKGCEELQLSKRNEGQEEQAMSSTLLPPVNDEITFENCIISNEFLSICLNGFANVRRVYLSYSTFTILPECIKECHFLCLLDLSFCKHLREIRGIPPNIQELWATECTSLSSESKSILLSPQVLHGATLKKFCMPGARIPEWFNNHYSKGSSISFCVRNNLPRIRLCHIVPAAEELVERECLKVRLSVNGIASDKFEISVWDECLLKSGDHIFVYDLQWKNFKNCYHLFQEDEWNHVEVCSKKNGLRLTATGMSIHVCNQESNMEDIRFMNPYKRRKTVDSSCVILHRSLEMQPLNDNLNRDSSSMLCEEEEKDITGCNIHSNWLSLGPCFQALLALDDANGASSSLVSSSRYGSDTIRKQGNVIKSGTTPTDCKTLNSNSCEWLSLRPCGQKPLIDLNMPDSFSMLSSSTRYQGFKHEQNLSSIDLQEIFENDRNKAKGKDIMICRDYIDENEGHSDTTVKSSGASSNSQCLSSDLEEWEYQLKCKNDQLKTVIQAKLQEVSEVPNESLNFTPKRNVQFIPTSNLRYEIGKVAYKGKLVDREGAERFVQLMRRHSRDTESNLGARILLLQVLANSHSHPYWLNEEYSMIGRKDYFGTSHTLRVKTLPILDKWLQDVLRGKFGDIEKDEFVEQFLLALLVTLETPLFDRHELKSCEIRKLLNLLLEHKSKENQETTFHLYMKLGTRAIERSFCYYFGKFKVYFVCS